MSDDGVSHGARVTLTASPIDEQPRQTNPSRVISPGENVVNKGSVPIGRLMEWHDDDDC